MDKNKPLTRTIPVKATNYATVKRMIDIICSVIMIILLTPVFLIISICIYIDSGSPILFQQTRIGKDGKPFVMWKFRTIPPVKSKAADYKQQYRMGWKDGVPDDFVFKSTSPSGITKLGVLLRKYSFDELPQLFNIVTGDMSLIGPRPEVPEITRYYNQEQCSRLLVKPGITGYAQIRGRSHLTHGEKVMYDRYYVENMSFRLDCGILAGTVRHMMKPDGSY